MNFKSEVVAYRGVFFAKKHYGLAKMWDEGTFFNNPEIKKTGGQIVKADSTKIIFELLEEVYDILLLDFSINDEVQLYRKIFFEIKEKYTKRTLEAVDNMDYREFGIPKKWGIGALKTIPKQVQGAMLFNYLFDDNLRPGDGVLQCQLIINSSRLLQYSQNHPPNSKYQLQKNLITSKLNVISFPTDLTTEDFDKVRKTFHELDISFDLRTIINFNVNMKLDQFVKLFKEETRRIAI
jgi:spermidine/putrescine-binding protein